MSSEFEDHLKEIRQEQDQHIREFQRKQEYQRDYDQRERSNVTAAVMSGLANLSDASMRLLHTTRKDNLHSHPKEQRPVQSYFS